MIQFEMEDVISVLQNCAPYLIGLGVVLLAGIIVLIAVRGAGKSRKFLIRAQTGLAMALALVLAVNGIMLNSVSACWTCLWWSRFRSATRPWTPPRRPPLKSRKRALSSCKTTTTPCPSPMWAA